MADRTNEQWLADLQADGSRRSEALADLRQRLARGLYFYLSTERSDLSDRPGDELQHLAEDFAQDALLKVLENLDTFRGESQFMTWASKIAARVAISELRRARYKDYSLDHLTAEGEIMPATTQMAVAPEGGPAPERYTEQQDLLEQVRYALDNVLTERQRMALTALALDGVPLPEVARMMGTNRNALYKLIHDARLKLKTYLEEQGISPDDVLDLFEAA